MENPVYAPEQPFGMVTDFVLSDCPRHFRCPGDFHPHSKDWMGFESPVPRLSYLMRLSNDPVWFNFVLCFRG